jgi:RNA polymerase sigma-70 factor (ECF subfamily)
MKVAPEPRPRRAPLPWSSRGGRDLTGDVEQARGGSVPAFERLYRATAGQVAGYLRWHGVGDVEGLTNEVFEQVHRNLGRFEGDGEAFRSWLFTIAHHRMVDDRRRAARRPQVDPGAEVDEEALVGDAESDAFEALGRERLGELLGHLSPGQRDVLLLRIVADLSIEDVAVALGKRPGAVKALQHRALASLRRLLEAQEARPAPGRTHQGAR